MVGALVTAPPAAASVTACGSVVAVNNSHGRLEVSSCIRHTPGAYASWGYYRCYQSGTFQGQACNIGATQHLWYNATRMRSDDVSALGLVYGSADYGSSVFGIPGSPAGCTSALIHTVISNIQVCFKDQTLWSSSATPESDVIGGSLSC